MMDTQWDAPTKRIAGVILGLIFLVVIYLSSSVLTFLVIAALIAFFLIPIVSFLQKRLHFPKWLAVIIAYLVLLVFVLMAPVLLIPAIINAFSDIQIDLVAVVQQSQTWTITFLENYRILNILSIEYDLSPAIDPALNFIKSGDPTQFIPSFETIIASIPTTIQFTWGLASNVVGTLASSLLAMVLTLLYSVYLTIDGAKFIRSAIGMAPNAYQSEVTELYRRIRAIWSAYFRGQFTLALIIGFITWLVGMIIGLPGALALGVMAGVLEILPNLGPILAAIPALLVALVQGSATLNVSNLTFTLIVLGAYVIIQQLENNFIVPKILGEAVELHPLTVMVGVVVGATTAGILGALLAAPVIASARVLMAYTYAKILDEPPFPPTPEKPQQNQFSVARLKELAAKLSARWSQLQSTAPASSEPTVKENKVNKNNR